MTEQTDLTDPDTAPAADPALRGQLVDSIRDLSVEDLGRDDFGTVGTLADYVAGNLLTDA
jgi:hypothetical protein